MKEPKLKKLVRKYYTVHFLEGGTVRVKRFTGETDRADAVGFKKKAGQLATVSKVSVFSNGILRVEIPGDEI